MSLKPILSLLFAKYIVSKTKKWSSKPVSTQEKVFRSLIQSAKKTKFGQDHHFEEINNYNDFKSKVPIKDYEQLKPYFEAVKNGEADVLWPKKPIYLCKTSGTTSGAKYIPISKESIGYHIKAARDSILHYIHYSGNAKFVDKKMIFLQGSPELDTSGPIPIGRLSGIVAHHVPAYLQKNRLPSFKTNCLEDWEEKVEQVCDETIPQDMGLISGIPPWIQNYFYKLIEKTGKNKIKDIFPNFSLFIFGGVNYEPYKKTMEKLIGKEIDSIELYPASEGFIAFQDQPNEQGMLLLLDSGIFYEFIPADEFFNKNPTRLSIKSVELNKNYVIILNTNAGLWGYNIGDTVRFVSLDPYRIIVSGRIKHFTSAFGEHVIAEEAEKAMSLVCEASDAEVKEFHLAPQLKPKKEELPFHEWFVEFKTPPKNLAAFSQRLNSEMILLNSYYKDLIDGKMLQPLKITVVKSDGFSNYMKSQGKLGGQNKLPRLANDRKIAEELV